MPEVSEEDPFVMDDRRAKEKAKAEKAIEAFAPKARASLEKESPKEKALPTTVRKMVGQETTMMKKTRKPASEKEKERKAEAKAKAKAKEAKAR